MSACQVPASMAAHARISLEDFDVTVKMALQESSVILVRKLTSGVQLCFKTSVVMQTLIIAPPVHVLTMEHAIT